MGVRLLALAATLLGSAVACSATNDNGRTNDDALDEAMPGVDESALDRSVDPCSDFYAFACGGYIAHVPATQHDAARAFGLQAQDDAILDAIVNEAQTAPVSDAERKFGSLYASCLATSTPGAASVVATLLPEIQAATTPEQLAGLVGRLERLGASAFFGIQSFDRTRKGSIAAIPGGFDEWSDYSDAGAVGQRTRLVANLFEELEPSLSHADAEAKAKTSVEIETKLAIAAQTVNFDGMHPLGQKGLELAAPAFGWTAFFAGIHAPADLGAFNIPGLDYFTAVNTLWTSLSPDAIRTYVESRWLAANDPGMGQQQRGGRPPEALCKENTVMLMNGAIESRFLELAGVNADGQGKARALFASIAAAFGEQLDSEEFLDSSTRIEAKVKLAKMIGAIGASAHTDDFADVTIDRNEPFGALTQRLTSRSTDQMFANLGKPVDLSTVEFPAPMVNAAYDPMHNKVDVPGGILGGYFFSPRAKNLSNFAAIGSVLGHELTHGFDDEGRLFDGDGDLRDWWSPEVADKFTARAQCLVDEYSAFTVDNVTDRRTGQPAHLNGQQTLGENIADNGGLRIAYRAAKIDQRKPTTVAGFSPQQQFFVSFAQLYCEKMSTETSTMLLKYDVHSPGKARVNLPVSNFDAFSQAFACETGKPMAPSNRCQVW